ncbi:MAG: hypothetical protein NZ455_12745 [Bacteroidia bacterium]|nr:hypothetical protein [Bacteroidia bacterium]MDW8346874.1 hypothetical protein [Bacteroidia bacterium]
MYFYIKSKKMILFLGVSLRCASGRATTHYAHARCFAALRTA